MPSSQYQSGYIAVLFAAILSLGLALAIGTLVAQLKKSGTLNRSFVASDNSTQQNELLADQRLLLAWYQNNAYALDSNLYQPNLTSALSQAGVQLNGASYDVSDLVESNGVGYHVFAFWFPVPGTVGPCFDRTTGIFSAGTVNCPANTAYALASGFVIEALYVQQTRTNMYRIADLLVNYFDDQNANDADAGVDTNWFCDPNNAVALPCYGTSSQTSTPLGIGVPINTTVLQPMINSPSMIGLSATDTITAWNPNTVITINSYAPPPVPPATTTLPPYTVTLSTALPWGGPPLTVVAVSN